VTRKAEGRRKEGRSSGDIVGSETGNDASIVRAEERREDEERNGKIGERHGQPVRLRPAFSTYSSSSSSPLPGPRGHMRAPPPLDIFKAKDIPAHPQYTAWTAAMYVLRRASTRERRMGARIMQLSADSLRGVAQRELALSRARRLMITVRSSERAWPSRATLSSVLV
jgi:hypothetical protein